MGKYKMQKLVTDILTCEVEANSKEEAIKKIKESGEWKVESYRSIQAEDLLKLDNKTGKYTLIE